MSRLTNEEFTQRIFNLCGKEYTFLQNYVSTHVKIKVKHALCNHIYEVSPNKFLTGRRCPKCSHNKPLFSHEDYEKMFVKLANDEYELLSLYNGNENYIEIKHKVCGKVYNVTPHKFKSGDRCRTCASKLVGLEKRLTDTEFKNRFKIIANNEYTTNSIYTRSNLPIVVTHTVCNYSFKVTPHNFLINRTKCPQCSKAFPKLSNKVLLINNYLNLKNVNFSTEKRFEECKKERSLPFDFFLEDINLLIEYDGEQHFKQSQFISEEKLNITKDNDLLKNNWCLKNKIPLVRIPYTCNALKIYKILDLCLMFNDQSKDVLYQKIGETGGTLII